MFKKVGIYLLKANANWLHWKAVFPSSLNYALGGCGCLFQGSCLLCIMRVWVFSSPEQPLSQADRAEQPVSTNSSGSMGPGDTELGA